MTSTTPGERVREARKRAGWSQGELSRRTNLRTETISRIETGKHGVGHESASAIAEALGVTIDWILSGPAADGPSGGDALAEFLAEANVSNDARRTLESVRFYGCRPTKLAYSMIWGALRACEPE